VLNSHLRKGVVWITERLAALSWSFEGKGGLCTSKKKTRGEKRGKKVVLLQRLEKGSMGSSKVPSREGGSRKKCPGVPKEPNGGLVQCRRRAAGRKKEMVC